MLFQVSMSTVVRRSGLCRHLLTEGIEPTARDLSDRSSRPRTSPSRTPARLKRKVRRLRTKRRLGQEQIGGRAGLAASTVHAILVRAGLNRLDHTDRVSGEPIHRYERARPGDLVHVDLRKFVLIPPGGG